MYLLLELQELSNLKSVIRLLDSSWGIDCIWEPAWMIGVHCCDNVSFNYNSNRRSDTVNMKGKESLVFVILEYIIEDIFNRSYDSHDVARDFKNWGMKVDDCL